MQDRTESKKAFAKQKQHALEYARERDQWSCRLQQQRNEEHTTELEALREKLSEAHSALEVESRDLQVLTLQHNETLREFDELKSSLAAERCDFQALTQQHDEILREVDELKSSLAAERCDFRALSLQHDEKT